MLVMSGADGYKGRLWRLRYHSCKVEKLRIGDIVINDANMMEIERDVFFIGRDSGRATSVSVAADPFLVRPC
jgi:hypothetical protein